MNRELLRRKFQEILAAYRTEPNLSGHEIVSARYPEFIVRSGQSGNEYTVNLERFSCSCQGFRNWNRCKHILFVIKQALDGHIEVPEEALFDISSYIRNYRHRTLNSPIQGELFGIEVEFKFSQRTTRIGNVFFQEFINLGGLVEEDASVHLEFKSPPLNGIGLLKFCLNPMWKNLQSLQDKSYKKQGIHVHVNWDDVFDVDRRPTSQSLRFILKCGEKIEQFCNFETVFGRQPNEYCRLCSRSSTSDRYCWLNLTNLTRSCGKTLEIRGFFSNPQRLLKNVFIAKNISDAIKRLFKTWRRNGRPDIDEYLSTISWKEVLGKKLHTNLMLSLGLQNWPRDKKERLKIILNAFKISTADYKEVVEYYRSLQ